MDDRTRAARNGSVDASVLGAVVTYHPDPDHLRKLVAVVAPAVRAFVVYANSELDAGTERALREAAGVTPLAVIRPGRNEGLGTAYNALAEEAEAAGDAFLFLLDQDSLPEPETVPELLRAFARLREAGETPAVIGPLARGTSGSPLKIRASRTEHYAATQARRTEHVISSGSLTDLAAAHAVGPFRADYFIDAIDIEWCMRANARGYSVWIADRAGMDHRLGQGLIRLPFGLRITRQPPLRLYTFLRNQLDMFRLAHVPMAHKARTLVKLPIWIALWLYEARFSQETATAIRRGLADGAARRLGPPQDRMRKR